MELPDTFSDSWLSTTTAAACLLIAYLVISLADWNYKSRRPPNFPPGPPTTPLLGNILDLPARKLYLRYGELARDHGEIVGLKIATQNYVVLNSARVVHELLEKRHEITSGRAYSGILKHVLRDGPHITVSEGEYLRRWRAAVRVLLRPAGLSEIVSQHSEAAARCVERIMVQAEDGPAVWSREGQDCIDQALEDWAVSVPLSAICGVRGADRDSAWTRWFFVFSKENLEIMEPSAVPPLDIFPILHYTPGFLAPWKAMARRVNDSREAICTFALEHARKGRESLRSGSSQGSLLARILEEEGSSDNKTKFSNEEIAKVGGGLLEASVHTTLASARTLLKILAAYPEVVAKMQQELDTVCGASKPPDVSHLDSLPYLKAVIHEAWRWRVPTPVSLPHRLTRDDSFEGYYLPKDTVIMQNTYSIMHDPELFDLPDEFLPERYLHHPAGLKKGLPPGPYRGTSFVFGAGRRACPGEAFAFQSLQTLFAKLLWSCRVEAAEGESVDLSPDGFFGETLVEPREWKMRIVLRSTDRKRAVVADREKLEAILD